MKISFVIVLFFCLPAVPGCPAPLFSSAQTEDAAPVSPQFPVTGKKWTLAFYLAGENSLEKDQVDNLQEICEGAAEFRDANIVVFFDRDDDLSRENLFTAWKGSRLFHVRGTYRQVIGDPLSVPVPRSIEADRYEQILMARLSDPEDRDLLRKSYSRDNARYVLREQNAESTQRLHTIMTRKAHYLLPLDGQGYANLDATDADTLSGFVWFVRDNFISEHYALFMAGHGNGWFVEDAPAPASRKKRSDEFFRDFETPMIGKALSLCSVDVLILDLCFMADVETAWALKDTADYIVFNQTSIPSMGLDYADLLERIGNRQSLSPEDMAIETVESYRKTYGQRQYPVSATALHLGEEFEDFVRSFQGFAETGSNLPALRTAAAQARYVLSRSQHRDKMVDLLRLVSDLKASGHAGELPENSGLKAHFSVNTALAGLSIYLPRSRALYDEDRPSYADTAFARDFPLGWVKVLPELVE